MADQEEKGSVATDMATSKLISSPVIFGGGLGGYAATWLHKLYLDALKPENMAVLVMDTCYSNDAYAIPTTPQFQFYRLNYSGAAWIAQQLKDPTRAVWKRDFTRHLGLDRVNMSDKGALEARNRATVACVEDLDGIEQNVVDSFGVCGYPAVRDVDQHSRFINLVHSLGGGSGGDINHHAAHLINLKYGDFASSRDSWVRAVGLGHTLYEDTGGVKQIYRAIEAAELQTASKMMLWGTDNPDMRFRGVLPGFESRATVDQMASGYFDEFCILQEMDADGGTLTLDLATEMAVSEIFWRSRFPRIVQRLKELQMEARDKVEQYEVAENTAFRFSTFGARFAIPHPNQENVGERQAAKRVAEEALNGVGSEPEDLRFSAGRISGLFDEWVAHIVNAGVRIPAATTMANAIALDPSAEITNYKHQVTTTVPTDVRRVLRTEVNVGEVVSALIADAHSEIADWKKSGALKPLSSALARAIARIRAIQQPVNQRMSDWEDQLVNYQSEIEKRKDELMKKKSDKKRGFFSDLLGGGDEDEPSDEDQLVATRASKAGSLLSEVLRQKRDDEIWTRIVIVRDEVIKALEDEQVLLQGMIIAFERFVDASDDAIRQLWQAGADKDTVVTHVVMPDNLETVLSNVSVPAGAVAETMRRILEGGEPVESAVVHKPSSRSIFGDVAMKNPATLKFFQEVAASLRVQAPIDKNEYGKSQPYEFRFIVCPKGTEVAVLKIFGEGWEIFTVDEDVFWFDVGRYNLPARAFRTTFSAETGLAVVSERDMELSYIWKRDKDSGYLCLQNRAQVEQEIAAALLLSPDLKETGGKFEVVPLDINGVKILENARDDFNDTRPLKQETKPLPQKDKDAAPEWEWKIKISDTVGRTIRTNNPSVLVDIISSNADYRDVLDASVRASVRKLDYASRPFLEEAIKKLEQWKEETRHATAEKKDESEAKEREREPVDYNALKKLQEEYEPLEPWVDMLLRGASDLNADRRWVQRYKHRQHAGMVLNVKFATA